MNYKKFFIGAFTILACCLAYILPVSAEGEEIITNTVEEYNDVDSDQTTPINNTPSEDSDSSANSEDPKAPNNQNCITNTDGSVVCTDLDEDELYNGTSGEPEVVCADENEPDCSEEETTAIEETEVEPEIWPMILSVSALGVTIICIIIFNIIGHNKNKK